MPEIDRRQQKILSCGEPGSYLCFAMSRNLIDTALVYVKLGVGRPQHNLLRHWRSQAHEGA
ncbi:hypothetical protein IE4803_PC00371 (plasmid) [Rhizobium etli bv. phaseoli str. IE4803]|nr:hypothetical protein IE4803_PC00371 [Rhizobium etli bv. phaseoli str. IE4803]